MPALHRRYLRSLKRKERDVLKALAVLGQPASEDLLAAILGVDPSSLMSALSGLMAEGTLGKEGGALFFRHDSFHAWLLGAMDSGRRRALHGRIASILGERAGASVEEVARHWLSSDSPRRGVPAAIEAARSLARDYQDRRALDFYGAVLELLPPGDKTLCREVAEEAASAYARAGEHRRGLKILEALLEEARGRLAIGRLHGLLGVFCHRAGEARAASHLERGLELLAGARGERWFEERLRMESELAEIKSNAGDYAGAESICRRALEEIDRRHEAGSEAGSRLPVRRARMVLLENLAHMRLRSFRFSEARELFLESLRAGEGLGVVPERSLILNNLGILHIQENRFAEAIECYRRADKLSSRIGDDQSLAAVHSNLAVLYAKVGEPEAAEEAIRRAAHHDARCDSRRTRFLRMHSAGVVDSLCGRYGSAIETLEAAIALGEELGDRHTVAFDLVYLAECHLYRGEARLARAALGRALALGPAAPPPVPHMARAREALLDAQRGDPRGAREALRSRSSSKEPGVSYLEAWNRVFLGWAHRLLKQYGEAETELEGARRFFARVKVPSGEIQASLELAALEADSGRLAHADKRLQSILRRGGCGRGPLKNPMLSARLLAYQTRLILSRESPDVKEATSSLVEAESYLIGRHLQDLEAMARELRRRLRALGAGREAMPAHPHSPLQAADGLKDLDLLRGIAAGLVRRFEEEMGGSAEGLRRPLRDFEERLEDARRKLEGKRSLPSTVLRADALLGSSPALRRLASLCLRVAPSAAPVLISGETGTGKELVARVIHGESPRRAGPFITLSAAALPAELLEAELFGYVRGAFSGAEEDHLGLLRSASGGTFLFDEISEMPLPLQAKIVRVLEEGRVRPVGGVEDSEVGARYLFTTSRDLRALVDEGRFRRDLFFRLGAVEIAVPPLRERLADLPVLVEHFRGQVHGADGRAPRLEPEALRALAQYTWPGNVRELGNLIQRLALTAGETMTAEDVRRSMGQPPPEKVFGGDLLRSRPLEDLLRLLEREYLLQLYADRGGDLDAMAAHLGIKVRALYDRFTRLDLRPRDLKKE